MSWFARLFKRQTVNTTHPRDPVLREWFAGGDGVDVNSRSALGVPAVYACVNVLSETLGAMPLTIWRVEGDRRIEATDHPLWPILRNRPCDYMTATEWVEWCVSCTALRGDAFNRIHSDGRGVVQLIEPLPFTGVRVERKDGRMIYDVRDEAGRAIRLQDDEVLRLPWKIQSDGSSLSPLALQRETFALAISSRRYQNKLFDNSAAPKGAIKVPTTLSPEAAEELITSWQRRHQGTDNAGRIAILDGGLEWQSIGMSNEDAQFAEMMQMSLRDVARLFRVQPHKIGDLENATFSNIEQQSIEFLTDTILPWVRRMESRFEGWLLNERERLEYSIEFNMRGLLRADAAARAALYQTLFYTSSITPNEIRRMEGMDPKEGGDRLYVQGASVPVDMLETFHGKRQQANG